MPDVSVLASPDVVATCLHPLRRRILELLDEPASATALAERLGEKRQLVNYHLRALEAAGVVELAEERQRRGVVERVLRRKHDVVLVSPMVLTEQRLDPSDRLGLAGVIGAAADVLELASRIAATVADDGSRVAAATVDTVVHLESPGAMRALVVELADVFARYDRPGEGALPFRIVTTALPDEVSP